MSEKKILKDEELNQVAGGLSGYKTIGEIVFKYEKGYTQEICDFRGNIITSIRRTHRATIIKRGYVLSGDGYVPVYYFQGVPNPEPDVDGWYIQDHVGEIMEYYDCTDFVCKDAKVTVVDW